MAGWGLTKEPSPARQAAASKQQPQRSSPCANVSEGNLSAADSEPIPPLVPDTMDPFWEPELEVTSQPVQLDDDPAPQVSHGHPKASQFLTDLLIKNSPLKHADFCLQCCAMKLSSQQFCTKPSEVSQQCLAAVFHMPICCALRLSCQQACGACGDDLEPLASAQATPSSHSWGEASGGKARSLKRLRKIAEEPSEAPELLDDFAEDRPSPAQGLLAEVGFFHC